LTQYQQQQQLTALVPLLNTPSPHSPSSPIEPPQTVEIQPRELDDDEQHSPSDDSLLSYYTAINEEMGTLMNSIDVDRLPN
jgi:hypothetical protein